MDTHDRRALLTTLPNPGPRLDYVVSLSGLVGRGDEGTRVSLRYIPDRWVLDPAGLDAYLDALAGGAPGALEDLAVMVLDDINNEVVARWVQVVVSAPTEGRAPVDHHDVMLEDRQPKWANDALLSRLKRF